MNFMIGLFVALYITALFTGTFIAGAEYSKKKWRCKHQYQFKNVEAAFLR